MPEKNRVVAGGMPVMIGTRNVAPNMATTCCIPIADGQRPGEPLVRGLTTSPGRTDLPLPWSFHLVPSMLIAGAFRENVARSPGGIFRSNFTAAGHGCKRASGQQVCAVGAGCVRVSKVTPLICRFGKSLPVQLVEPKRKQPVLPDAARRDVGLVKGTPMTIAHEEAVIDSAAVDAIFAEARTANAFTGEVTRASRREPSTN